MSQEMKQIKIAKVVVNVGTGQVGDPVEKSVKLVEKLTDSKAVRTESGGAAKTFGKRAGLNLGVMTTLRGEEAREFLQKVMPAAGDEISAEAFDGEGNFSFGVSEYIDVPGIDYDSDIGMRGFEAAVKLERPGYRVKKRDHKPREIGKDHKISDDEAKDFVQDQLGVEVKE
ncbi:MAG: ribosomal protein L5 [Candidatus Nanosalina sp. J07AB43]|nr:MAG: ribosomal protein L5 [Candidatus Nanosalina sp. J07AB43]